MKYSVVDFVAKLSSFHLATPWRGKKKANTPNMWRNSAGQKM
jgi:hypothetical protein